LEVVAIILARGGSKGLPKKNILDFCGKPLVAWTIEQCITAGINDVFVSSDSEEILRVAARFGAKTILRPIELADDMSSAESGWKHALSEIDNSGELVDWVLAPQVTSPLREITDIRKGILAAESGEFDSIFSCSLAEDLFFWQESDTGLESVNYDWKNRKRRQDLGSQVIENGSFYFFKPDVIRENNNRLGGRIGTVEMAFWKMFEIDSQEDFRMCSALMNEFLISKGNSAL
jgi:CMP-N,N'-diacetyllegionaminic acid synthase